MLKQIKVITIFVILLNIFTINSLTIDPQFTTHLQTQSQFTHQQEFPQQTHQQTEDTQQAHQQVNTELSHQQIEFTSRKTLQFSGYPWYIKTAPNQMGPQNNWFGQKNVYVDKNGLNLKITKQGNKWVCGQVVLTTSKGYGTYAFAVAKGYEKLDPNVVFGLFTYHDIRHQIDFEISKWGQPNNINTQFVVQPFGNPGNIKRFNANGQPIVLAYTWGPTSILFQAFYANSINEVKAEFGKQSNSKKLISQWTYTGRDKPAPMKQNARINLWLIKPPMNGKEQMVTVKEFKFIKR